MMGRHRFNRREWCMPGLRHAAGVRHIGAVGCGPAQAWDRFAPRIGGLRWRCTEERYCRRCGKRLGMVRPAACATLTASNGVGRVAVASE